MSENDNKKEEQQLAQADQNTDLTQGMPAQTDDFEFLKEKIKERPIDKKKLLQRTIITASMALLFGLIACFTFLLLEPVLNNWLYPEEEPNIVTFPEEAEEILPEDMLSEENDNQQAQSENASEESTEMQSVIFDEMLEIYQILGEDEDGEISSDEKAGVRIAQFQLLYQDMYRMTQQIQTSMVTVTGVTSDVDWFNNTYQNEGKSAGLLIANNGRELLILCNKSAVDDVEKISVSFCNQRTAEAYLKKYDVNTDLAVIAVDLKHVAKSTLDTITIANLGTSNDASLVGQPIIAIGQINGYSDSVSYGILTSINHNITLADNEYRLMTTDILSSQKPSGILINMDGEVIGIVKNDYNNSDTVNMLSAIGITELKGMISKISNNISVPYLGVYAVDVTEEIHDTQGVPFGAYVTDIDMDSPAMRNGMQKGDVIIKVGDNDIASAADYMTSIRQYLVDRTVSVTVLRSSQNEYQEMTFDIIIEEKE